MKFLKNLFKKEDHVHFTIDSDKPLILAGTVYEDNMMYYGRKFQIVAVDEVEHDPERYWPYIIKGKAKIL